MAETHEGKDLIGSKPCQRSDIALAGFCAVNYLACQLVMRTVYRVFLQSTVCEFINWVVFWPGGAYIDCLLLKREPSVPEYS